jgi:phospholipid/cholesterol/gamma-HCH transport system substrate-binding protein
MAKEVTKDAEGITASVKLGLFVLAGLFVLILTLYLIGKSQNLFGSNVELKARFRNVSGLMSGSNILFSGIQVGTVNKIHIIDDTTIEVGFLVDKQMLPYIHRNARVSIGTEGLMGNKIINILPVNESSPAIREGELLSASQDVSTDEMLATLDKTNMNIAAISEGLKSSVQRLNDSKALWGILNDSSLALNMKASMENISRGSVNVNAVTQDLRAMIADVKNGEGSVGVLLRDTAFSANLEQTLVKIKKVGDKAAALGDELDQMVGAIRGDIDHGTGTVHALLKDSSLTMKLSATMDNVQRGTESFSQDMEALKHNFLLRGYFRRLDKQQKKDSTAALPRLAIN